MKKRRNAVHPTADAVVRVNQMVCQEGGNTHHCYDIGKIESAIHTAFYHGEYPYPASEIGRIAGSLCFYLTKNHAFMDGNKRTAALTAISFLNENGWELLYPFDEKKGTNALAIIVDDCAASKVSKDQLMDWFDAHKVKIK